MLTSVVCQAIHFLKFKKFHLPLIIHVNKRIFCKEMQAEERIDSTLTHRKTTNEKPTNEDKEIDVNSSENEVEDEKLESLETTDPPKIRQQEDFTTWGNVKYKFYLFRYYHYYYADKLDKYLAAGCLWIMRVYFRFLGLVEEAETRDEE